MKVVRLIPGVIIVLMAITLVAEAIEFVTVKLTTGKSFAVLSENQQEYFEARNRNWILMFKVGYSLLAGIVGGFLSAWIAGRYARLATLMLIVVQVLSLIWAGFLSDLGETGPVWMWLYLMGIIPLVT